MPVYCFPGFLAFFFPFFLSLSSNDTNKNSSVNASSLFWEAVPREAFCQPVLSFHKEYLALGSGFLLYLPVQEAFNFSFSYSQCEKCLVEH